MTDSAYQGPYALNAMDEMDEETELTYKPGQYVLSEEELDKKLDKRFEDFYRRVYPGFTLSSGLDTMGHGRAELCLTTDTAQGIHWYEQGNCKLGSRKSVEIRTGDKATGNDMSVVIEADNGHIKIHAKEGNLILKGRNVLLEATADDGQVTLSSGKNMKLDAPTILMETDHATLGATTDMLLYGGSDCLLYCEGNPVETGSGQDIMIAKGLTAKLISMLRSAKMLFAQGG
tara:strand:- start:370 stop:1062 length:693 start_codon:yes stop_codon:yes gene_type:complete